MKFETWFRKQFGPDPCPDEEEAKREANELMLKLGKVEDAIRYKKLWDIRKTAARYAWNLKEDDKK